jgi:hypothetical protein
MGQDGEAPRRLAGVIMPSGRSTETRIHGWEGCAADESTSSIETDERQVQARMGFQCHSWRARCGSTSATYARGARDVPGYRADVVESSSASPCLLTHWHVFGFSPAGPIGATPSGNNSGSRVEMGGRGLMRPSKAPTSTWSMEPGESRTASTWCMPSWSWWPRWMFVEMEYQKLPRQ